MTTLTRKQIEVEAKALLKNCNGDFGVACARATGKVLYILQQKSWTDAVLQEDGSVKYVETKVF